MAQPFNLPPLPQWRGYTAANNADPAMYSMDGRWYKEGQTINNGYTIGPRDPKTGQLSLLYQGGALPISMAGSSPLPMPEVPEFKRVFTMGGIPYTEADLARMQELNKDGELDMDIERAKKSAIRYQVDPTLQMMFGKYNEMQNKRMFEEMQKEVLRKELAQQGFNLESSVITPNEDIDYQ